MVSCKQSDIIRLCLEKSLTAVQRMDRTVEKLNQCGKHLIRQRSNPRPIDKNVVHTHGGILLSHKKENLAICNNMNGPRGYHAK